MSTRHTVLSSPIGDLTVVRDDDGITGVHFPHHWPTHADGDDLERQVRALLAAVPYGSTVTYGHRAGVLGCTAQQVLEAV